MADTAGVKNCLDLVEKAIEVRLYNTGCCGTCTLIHFFYISPLVRGIQVAIARCENSAHDPLGNCLTGCSPPDGVNENCETPIARRQWGIFELAARVSP